LAAGFGQLCRASYGLRYDGPKIRVFTENRVFPAQCERHRADR